MQAVKAYYDDGKFIPLEPIKVAKGSQAIVTILDFPIRDGKARLSTAERLKDYNDDDYEFVEWDTGEPVGREVLT